MNKLGAFVILLSLSLNGFAAAPDKDATAWGKIIIPTKSINGVAYKYFIYYEQDGKSHAYPIDTDRKDMVEIIKNNIGQSVRIQGKIKELTLNLDGSRQKVLVFMPSEIGPLTLTQLSATGPISSSSDPQGLIPKEKQYNGGGISVNDDLANAMIYTGAAILIGTQLGKGLLKKR